MTIEWKPCPEYGTLYGQHSSENAIGEVTRGSVYRRCPLRGLVHPSTCAACPIPEAMRAKKLWDALRQRVLDLIKEAEEHQTAAAEDAAKEYWENRAAELLGFHDMMLKEAENAA